MGKALLVVGTNPTSPDRDKEYNEWYTGTHLDDVVAVNGFSRAKRYMLSDTRPMADRSPSPYRYPAIHEVDTDDLSAVAANMKDALDNGRKPLSSALSEDLSVDFYVAIEGAERP